MPERKRVSKRNQLLASIFRRIGFRISMVEMNLDFSPSCVTVICQRLHQPFVVLLSWIEIGVDKGTAIMIPPWSHELWIFAAPPFKPALLLVTTHPGSSASRVDGRFKVIRKRDDEMHMPVGLAAGQPLPPVGRQNPRGIGQLAKQAHTADSFPRLMRSMVSSPALQGFASTHRDRNLGHVQVLHAHVFIPPEHLLVRMFGLILGRVPIKGIRTRASGSAWRFTGNT